MESSTAKPHQITFLDITADQAGQRIDNFLLTYLKGVPKSHVYRILRTGEVRVNKGRVKPLYRLQAGDQLRLPPVQYNTPTLPSPRSVQELANTTLYEDAHLLIIDKPTGIAVHGGSGIHFGVIEGLRALYPKLHYLELVHRLDRDTSGCLMIAKKSSMLRRLHELLRHGGGINKQYLALVQGPWNPRWTIVEANLRKNLLLSGERIVRVHADGKPSQTQFKIEQCFANATLLRVHPLTGRTHQIRVHAAYMGHPIAGDNKYGDETFNQQMRHYQLTRLFLHATQLEINLPGQDSLTVHAPLPVHLRQVLHRLTHVTARS